MEKPLDLVIYETKEVISQVIAESHLHISIIEMIMKDLYSDISKLSQRSLNDSMSRWAKAQEEVKDDGEHKPIPESDT